MTTVNETNVADNATDSNVTDSSCIICRHALPVSAVTSIQVFIGIAVTVANFINIFALAQCRSVKKTLRMLLINQSVADTLFGLAYIYHSAVVYIVWYNIPECIFRYASISLSSGVSLNIITILSLERIVAIKMPYSYHKVSTPQVMTLTGLQCWLSPTVVIVTGLLFAETNISECNFLLLASPNTLAIFGVLSLVLILVIIACNVVLFISARDHIKKIIPTFVGKEKYVQGIKMNLKATLTSASVIIPFLVLNAPQYTFFVVLAARPSLRYQLGTLYVMNFFSSLIMINSVLNPMIYIWRVKELRAQLIKFVCPKDFNRAQIRP